MGVVVTSRVGRGGTPGWMHYVCLGNGDGDRVAGYCSDLGDPVETVEAVEAYMTGTRRTCEGLSVVHSFPLDELNPANPDDVQRAVDLTYQGLRRMSPHAPMVVVAHTDAEGGHLHTHALVVNHDTETGRAVRDNWMHWTVREKINEVCVEQGLSVPTPSATRSRSPHLGPAPAEDTLTPSACRSRADVRQYLGGQIDAAILVDGVRTPDDVFRVLADRGISTVRKPDTGHGDTLTFAAVDADGEVIRAERTSKRGRKSQIKVAASGHQLGTAYTLDGISAQIAEVVAYKEMEKTNASTRQTESSVPEPTPKRHRRTDPDPTPSTDPDPAPSTALAERPRRHTYTPEQVERMRRGLDAEKRRKRKAREQEEERARFTLAGKYLAGGTHRGSRSRDDGLSL